MLLYPWVIFLVTKSNFSPINITTPDLLFTWYILFPSFYFYLIYFQSGLFVNRIQLNPPPNQSNNLCLLLRVFRPLAFNIIINNIIISLNPSFYHEFSICPIVLYSPHTLFKKNLFVLLFWLLWVFVAARGATLHCGARTSPCGGFSCCGAWALGAWASVVVARGLSSCGLQALERRLNSWGTRA